MKKLLIPVSLLVLFACNNEKKENKTTDNSTSTTSNENTSRTGPDAIEEAAEGGNNTLVTIDGKDMQLSGSILVTKDKTNLHPGAGYFVRLTASGGPNNESLTVNFVMDNKAGVYPIVGLGLVRDGSANGQVFGGLGGGDPQLSGNSININEVKDLGENGTGGHKWSVSGNFSNITIPAMKLMLMDKTANHPTEVKIDKGSFSNLTFDDNVAELMRKAAERMKNSK